MLAPKLNAIDLLTALRGIDAIATTWPARERALFADGPSIFGYATQSPLSITDPNGLQPKDQRFGLSNKFWQWYHRFEKLDGAPDLTQDEACALYDEWCAAGCPMRPL
jgi:hypothetical protein